MPVVSSHVFANHKGGVGKTMLTFQTCAAYAAANPKEKVLVLDMTETGDVSEFLLGGVLQGKGHENYKKMAAIVNCTDLLLRCLTASMPFVARTIVESGVLDEESPYSQTVGELPHIKEAVSSVELRDKMRHFVNIAEFAIPLYHLNPVLPINLYLCPSSGEAVQQIPFSDYQCRNIVEVLRSSFDETPEPWKIIIDTDTEPTGSASQPNVYTKIALAAADFCCIPLRADMVDWHRIQTTFDEILSIRSTFKVPTKVHMIIWNSLSVQLNKKWQPPGGKLRCPFTPTKAEQDIVQTLDALVYETAKKNPGLFVHYPADMEEDKEVSVEEFGHNTGVCVRSFGVMGVASRETGVPITHLHHGSVHGAHVTYLLSLSSIGPAKENLDILVKNMNDVRKAVEVEEPEGAGDEEEEGEEQAMEVEGGNGQKSELKEEEEGVVDEDTGVRKRKAGGEPEEEGPSPTKLYNLRPRAQEEEVAGEEPAGSVEVTKTYDLRARETHSGA